MYELKQLGSQSYYIESPAKIGIYKQNDTDIYLIDSGNDKEAGKKVLKIANQNNWRIKAIINTHSNADHIGGNHYIQEQTGCPIFAKGIEVAFTNHPILESSFLYGGYPCRELRGKFLLAKASQVKDISHDDFPKELEVFPLPGHFFDMIGLRTPDDTIFLADCISSKSTLEKYQVSFVYDVAQYLDTLDRVESMQGKIFVPAHAEVTENIKELVQSNRNKIYEIVETLLDICEKQVTIEDILQQIFDRYNLTMTIEQYVLVGSTIRSYLSWLKDNEKITFTIQENKLLWKSLVNKH
ncbi:MBL fold metallo-hydrolase [Bacteroides stercorirosoris]|uniref:Glyoxylase, beta-lactamase superfamily II n=1 Tax=Bacteroides stercorirosoris TaxID=871324 RepID=A0A1M6FHE3_9BACE|nr:MBL fold metallo-hydrolase [Bacteroides stercorirosoris]SHI97073.1 Glyoxylase, beta-lactamase superfamily II [Bacteroides stercorirosoris]